MLKIIEDVYRNGTIEPAPEAASLRVATVPKRRVMRSGIITLLMLLLISCFLGLVAIALGIAQQVLLQANTSGSSNPAYSAEIRRQLSIAILSNPDPPLVLEQAKAILKTGLKAGSGYGQTWIRDLNTFIELALDVQAKPTRKVHTSKPFIGMSRRQETAVFSTKELVACPSARKCSWSSTT